LAEGLRHGAGNRNSELRTPLVLLPNWRVGFVIGTVLTVANGRTSGRRFAEAVLLLLVRLDVVGLALPGNDS
jgi:hypothetical protein